MVSRKTIKLNEKVRSKSNKNMAFIRSFFKASLYAHNFIILKPEVILLSKINFAYPHYLCNVFCTHRILVLQGAKPLQT